MTRSAWAEVLAARASVAAPRLLGAEMTSELGPEPITVRITEVEAYEAEADPASHAYRGRTRRNEVMFSGWGLLYCYFVYGMHWCANVTTGEAGAAGAVLLRAASVLEPVSGPGPDLRCRGPAKLARLLSLSGDHTGLDLLDPCSPVRLGPPVAEPAPFAAGPRVGVSTAADVAWRFWTPGEPTVSAYRRGGRPRSRGAAGRPGRLNDRE